MSLGLMSFILIGTLLILLAAGVHIAIAIGLVGALGLLLFVDQPLNQFAYSAFEVMNSFVLTAVPLFSFMGAIFHTTGLTQFLFSGADRLIRGLPGGIACSVMVANAIFGAMEGSSVAATATFGKTCYPQMERLGYKPSLSLGSIAIGGTLAVLIPPSVILIVYGSWQNVSVARLFAAGMIPGIILASLLMLTVIVLVKLNPSLAPKVLAITMRERLTALVDILPFVVVIGLVLGSIFGGIMTPTEAASLGAALSILLALAYRRMTFAALKESMRAAVSITAMLALLMVTSRVLGQVFQYIGLIEVFSGFMLGLPFGKYGIFAVICVMYLILGMFFESFAMLVLTLPFVSLIISDLGFNLVWFGVVYVVLAEIGMVTPPFGLNLFVLHNVVPQHDIMKIALGVLPFMIPLILMVVILTAFPQLALWLPGILY